MAGKLEFEFQSKTFSICTNTKCLLEYCLGCPSFSFDFMLLVDVFYLHKEFNANFFLDFNFSNT